MQFSCSDTVHRLHILNIPGVVKCPGAGKKLTVKCPGAGNFFCANARGCSGGMVRAGIEQDIRPISDLQREIRVDYVGLNGAKL